MSYWWVESYFTLPPGVVRLGADAPFSGKTYIMYHGTDSHSAMLIQMFGFKRSIDGMLGPGVYLSRDLQKASRYPIGLPDKDKVVIRVRVKVGKVIAINYQQHPQRLTWPANGYDTAWVPPNCGMVSSGLEEDCVWDPARIKVLNIIRPQPTCGYAGFVSYKNENRRQKRTKGTPPPSLLPCCCCCCSCCCAAAAALI